MEALSAGRKYPKMRVKQSSVRDGGTVMFFCGTVPPNVGRLASMFSLSCFSIIVYLFYCSVLLLYLY